MLKVWNLVLVLLTFVLTIFGTFITRSGVISSVHAFTQSGLGPFFLAFLLVVIGISLGLLLYRLPELRSENEIESFLSREASFLFNNLILVGIAFATFWGTIFPILSEAVRGVKITVGPPFFNRVNTPLGLVLLALIGIGPVIAWRRATPRNLRSAFLWPALSGLAAGVLLAALGVPPGYALLTFVLGTFVLGTVVQEFWRGVRARQAMVQERAGQALVRLIGKNRRRYGGYIIHVGVVLIFFAIAASNAFKIERLATVAKGQEFTVGPYRLRYARVTTTDSPHLKKVAAVLEVSRDGERIGTLEPEKRLYKRTRQPTTEVAMRSTLAADLYVVLGAYDPDTGLATFQAYLNPMVAWLWIGGLIIALGTVVVMLPPRASRQVTVTAPEGVRAAARR